MAVTITRTPPTLVPVLNPASYILRTDQGAGTVITLTLFMQRFYGGQYQQVIQLQKAADNTGQAQFYIHELLRRGLDHQLPDFRSTSTQRLTQPCKRFYITCNDGTGLQNDQAVPHYALLAGSNFFDFPTRSGALGPGNRKIMTTRPLTRTIDPVQNDWCWLLLTRDTTTIAEIECVYSDGSTIALTRPQGVVREYQPTGVPLGYAAQNYPAVAGAFLQQINLSFSGSSELANIAMTIIPNNRPQPWKRQYAYANSAGTWETVITTGLREERVQRDSVVESQHFVPDVYPPTFGQYRHSQPRVKKVFTQHTGYRSAEEHAALEDILNTSQVYEIVSGDARRLLIQANEYTVRKDKRTLNSFEMEYTYAHDNTGI